ncbi:cyclase family protein [Mesorhizobium sp. YR577]|uniref:cyclase family protein n=1 Tax=Mesorhizobium sp. YR577 TaxID=1884373 RepID=UPI0008F0C6A1|nr:cyclase family protein [Mesorhizobium sp. YR577]SFU21784.1 Kynurenine formamidase [Mesorhizobium sp. YR577]
MNFQKHVQNPVDSWIAATSALRQIDLSHPMQKGMPVHPAHPPFHITLNNRHGDVLRSCGHSSSNELIVMSTHSSTHIDAICHVSDHGSLFGCHEATNEQTGTDLFKVHGAETIGPIFRRGVLLDVARIRGLAALDPAYEVTVDDLKAAEEDANTTLQKGDIVLVRTGWGQYWSRSQTYLGLDSLGAPGPGVAAGRWLAERKPFCVGSDTSAFEVMNHHNITLEVHLILIAQSGVHIIENLNLEELSEARAGVFAFAALPLRINGATGSPLRPLALL